MKDSVYKLVLASIVTIETCILLSMPMCGRNETKTVTTKKKGKTELVKHTTTITVDSQAIFRKFSANTKPVIKWLRPKVIHDTVNPNTHYSPCDSIVSMSDTGTFQGVKYSIMDTISDNRIIGRYVSLNMPQLTINKTTINTNDSLRVDTVYVTTKEKKKRFSVNIGTGFGFSPLSPVPHPQIGINVGFDLKRF